MPLPNRPKWRETALVAAVAGWAFASCATGAVASQAMGDVQPNAALDSKVVEQGKSYGFFNDTSFLIVPIPVSNPTIGSGGALATAMFFKTDPQSQSSLIGAGGFYTSSGSWGAAATTDLAFSEDRYHVKGSAGYATVTYDFYGVGSGNDSRHVSLTQSGYLFDARLETRVAPHLYIGGQGRYMTIKTKFNLPDLAGDLLENGGPLERIKNSITTIGFVTTYDSRDKDYSPSSGALMEGAFDIGLHDFVTKNSFTRTTASYSRYDKVADDLVLASHGSLCMTNGQVPIFDLCMFGAGNDLRGYAVGRFQDKAMFAAQEELRWHAFWRIGFVAFGGIGSVAHSVDKFSDILAAGGVGLRFLASKEYGVNIGIDGAINKDGEKSFYIMVGEAF